MAVKYQHPRGTRAALTALAGASGLIVGQIYLLTDENRLAVATSTSAFSTFEKEARTTITYVMDGGGVALTTGVKGDLEIPFACVIEQWTLLGDQSGSAVVDIWKDNYASYPPAIGDVITASAKPTITAATKGQSSTLTGWTTTINANDILRFNINSVSSFQRLTLSLRVRKI